MKGYIRDYIGRDLDDPNENPAFKGVDISDPRTPDMSAIRTNQFELRDIEVVPATERQGVAYHFVVGKIGGSKTQVSIQGTAAKYVSQQLSSIQKSK